MRKKVSAISLYFFIIIVFGFFNLINFNTYADLTQQDYFIWSAPSTVKVKYDDINYSNKGPASISINAAKNEYESYQLFITAYKNISSYYLSTADLTDGKGNTISASNITVYNEKYINCNMESVYSKGYYPDALIPIDYALNANELTISANRNAALWITFYIPEDTEAGTYTSTFCLSLENIVCLIPVTVNVYDYTLTNDINFKTAFTNRVLTIAAGELDSSYEMMKEYYDFCLDYRISLNYLPKKADTTEDLVEAALEYFDKTACYKISVKDIKKLAEASTSEKNLLSKAYLLELDEPYMYYRDGNYPDKLPTAVNILKDIHTQLNNIVNQIENDFSGKYTSFKQIDNWQSYITDISIIVPDHLKQIYEDIDVPLIQEYLANINTFCPLWDTYDDTYRGNYLNIVEQYNPDLWWYSTLAPTSPYADYHIADTNLLSSRSISWMQKKYNIEGNLFWDIAGYTVEGYYDNFEQMKLTPINVYEYPYRFKNASSIPAGDGNLLYPGAAYGHYGPLPSMRLMSIRDGLEEYEMLSDLENKYQVMADSGKYGSFNVKDLMENLYAPLYYEGNKLYSDGQGGLNFNELRSDLLYKLSNIGGLSSVARTYNPIMNLKLSIIYDNGSIVADTIGGLNNYQYQYWVKTKVPTDNNSSNVVKAQYIWQIFRNFNTTKEANLAIQESYRDENGKYNIMVRIKEGDTVIEELYGAYSAADLGQPLISQININGKGIDDNLIVIYKGQDIDIKTIANMDSLNTFLYIGNSSIPLYTGNEITANFDSLPSGLNTLRIEVSNGTNRDIKNISVYIVDTYLSDQMPVISSLTGESTNGNTTFIMKVRYADESPISSEDKDNYVYSLTSETTKCQLVNTYIADGFVEAVFNINYGATGYGIYKITGTVTRKDKSGEDDKIIKYYDGYKRNAELELTGNTEIVAGESVQISASGQITGSTGTITYAFYREDASGWVLIRNYSESGQFQWTPVRPGKYKIQVRIKDSNAGSYEGAVTKVFNVTGPSLQGNLNLKIYDYESGKLAQIIYAGKPYKIFAEYLGTEDVLYMFTLTTDNLGTIYLNSFSPNPYYMFVPQSPGNCIITARALNCNNYGYMDKYVSERIDVTIQLKEYPDVIDFENKLHTNYFKTPNNNNAVNFERINYNDTEINKLTGGGDYALKLTPTVNPWPEFHIIMKDKFKAMISFDYYIETPTSGDFSWNSKNSNTGDNLGEIESFTKTSGNWYHAEHVFNFESNEIWLWLYLDYPSVSDVHIYIDNIRIINIDKFPGVLDIENSYHMFFINTPDNDNAVTINKYSYSDLAISPLSDGGNYAMKFTPTVNPWPEIHIMLKENFSAGFRIEFDYFIQSSVSGIYAWNYKNPTTGASIGELDRFENAYNNTWYHASHTINFDSSEIWLWLYLDGYPDVTEVNIYIDNFRVIRVIEDVFTGVFDFETEEQINYFKSVNPAGHTMNVVFDIVSYEDAGLTVPSGCGDSLMKITPTHPDCGHLLFEIHNNYIIPSGSSISFKLYIQAPQSASNFYLRYWDNSADDVRNLSSNQWYDIVIHTTIDSPQNYIYLYLRNYAINPATNLNMYIDNLTVITGWSMDDGFNFETEEQINYFNSVNPAGHTMNVVFDIVSYEDVGLTVPSGCGDSLMKITPTHPDCGHLLFEIHNNYIIPSGSSISFKLYIQAPQSASNFYLRYWDNSADDVRNLSSNQWYDIVIHTTIDSPQNYIYLYLRNYAINPATNLNMYIDNLTISLP
jgi:hypothetical protein